MKSRISSITVFLFLASSASHLLGSPVVEGSDLRIRFSPETGGVLSIVNTDTAHDFISARTESPKLWRLVLKKKNGERAALSNETSERPVMAVTKMSADLFWTNLVLSGVRGGLDIHVYCRISPADRLAHFRINVQNRSDASILSAVFPEISGLGTSGKSDVAFPKFNWGQMFPGLTNRVEGYYPSADTPMQFCSLSDHRDTVYLATHDPSALCKTFAVDPGKVFSVETAVPDATVAGNSWQAPYDFVLRVFEGDWATSCKLYRNWAIRDAPWTARGPIFKRKDVSPAVKEIGVWLNLADKFADNEPAALKFRKEMGVPIGVHWYDWHSNPFDKDYPDYLPAKPGFADTVKKLKESQIYSMPYINGRLWDTQNRNYNAARPYATHNQAGEPILEDYGSGTKLAVMCLGHPFWQTHLSQLIEQVVDKTGAGGIYIDQVAGAAMGECYDQSHGHTLGRDHWWMDGYRKSITAARDYCHKSHGAFFVAAENNAEPYMDFVDLFLIWIPRSQDDIPMMTAVYGGYAQYFGTNRGSDSDMSFAMLQARDFTWGAQLFWESAFILQPGQEEKLKMLGNLARLRYRARKYLVEGELINVVKPLNSMPLLIGKWGGWSLKLEDRTLPAVHAALWKANDNSRAIVLANAAKTDQAFEFEFAPAAASSRKWHVQKLTQSESENLGVVRKGNSRLTVSVPARDGLLLQFK